MDWLAKELDEWEDSPQATARRRKAVAFPRGGGIGYYQEQPGMPTNHGNFWTDTQEGVLRAHWRNKLPIATIAREMGRTENSISSRLKLLGLIAEAGKALVKQQPDQPLKESKFVNLLHAITLLQEGYTTLEGVYPGNSQRYIFKVSDAVRSTLKEDDHVVVFTRGEYKVTKVVKIHDRPEIDVKAPFELKWIVCRVNNEAYDDQTQREKEAIEKMAKAERRKAAEEAAAALFGNIGSREELLALINPR